ncbi:MAG: Nramp family divalent metal transporter [Candidatus Latescibacterota bacterium]|nr:Nramp family divalent metal transporter [Candidatus Latescibacterota bacterium]
MTDTPLRRFPELPRSLAGGGLLPLLRFFGPGAIIASVTIGSGETVFASRGGAIFGTALLWCFIGGGVMKFVQVYSAARFITLTGEHPMERWRLLPGPSGWAVWVLAVLTIACFPLWLSGLPKMLGGLVVWIGGLEDVEVWGDARLWGTLFALAAITLTMVQSYGALERMQTIIVGVLLCLILAATFASQPDWLAVVHGSVVPVVPHYPAWVADKYPVVAARSAWIEMGVYLGAIGGGSQDYFGYIGLLREKRWGLMADSSSTMATAPVPIAEDDENLERGRRWLRAPLADSVGSFTCVVLFTMAFMILGATLLHPSHIVPSGLQLLSVQADFLTNMHPKLLYVYQMGVFTAFFGTIMGAYELYVRTTHECLRPVVARVREMSISQLRPWVVCYCGIGGVLIMWLGGNPVQIVTPAAIFGGVLTCGLWCLLMVWTDRRFLPPQLRMGKLLLVLNIASGLFLTGWGIRGVFDFVGAL